MGKGPMELARLRENTVYPSLEAEECHKRGRDGHGAGDGRSVFRPQEPLTLKEAMEPERAKENLRRTGEQIVRMVRTFENGSRRRSEIME